MDRSIAPKDELRRLAILLGAGAAAALVGVLMSDRGGYLAVTGVCILVALAAFAAGSGVGFIFGLPRVFSDDAQAAKVPGNAAGTGDRNAKPLLKSNANLERVSDWLTTMIVGVALTELHNLGAALLQFQQFLRGLSQSCPAQNPCDTGVLAIAGPIILILAAVVGFLFMYLYTRLVLTPVFNRVEGGLSQPLSPSDQVNVLQQLSASATAEVVQGVDGSTARRRSLRPAPAGSMSLDSALQLMFAALYEQEPAGFTKALNLAGVLMNTAAVQRADFWFYQAAAFGQQLNYLRANNQPEGDVQSARDNALDCARRAVDIDASYRARLRSISNPGGLDDDLAGLRGDPAFEQILTGP